MKTQPILAISNLTASTVNADTAHDSIVAVNDLPSEHTFSAAANPNKSATRANKPLTKQNKSILKGIELIINPGEVHAIMGPNGSGKSTLANLLARNPNYQADSGSITFLGHDLLKFTPEDCARHGLFLSFQHPVAIPGVSNIQFLKTAVNSTRRAQNLKPFDAVDFLQLVKTKMAALEIPENMLYRAINDDFSGGEKKRNEILQMALLEPKLIVLDEIDSGLDVDALQTVAKQIDSMRNKDRAILLITHYQRLLDYIKPDKVHVLADGKIIHSGDSSLPLELEQRGYAWLKNGEHCAN